MSAIDLIKALISEGVEFSTDGERIRWSNSNGKVTDDVKAKLAACKPEVIAYLKDNPSPQKKRWKPIPPAEWSRHLKPQRGDPERYLQALQEYGPLSYGMAMRALGWGGTRAGQVQDELHRQGRIKFDKRGWAYPVDRSEDSNDRSS
ncbi:hypothetical protein [Brucella rhizosphaerae]|uniref:TubC N-terminal docking domain-related protein n=1 Tax=Brucella rhizosphaerae TaxID=571254 RepID=UPI000467A388|nr:hypothetical protein [Brucella rhizosphaerae]